MRVANCRMPRYRVMAVYNPYGAPVKWLVARSPGLKASGSGRTTPKVNRMTFPRRWFVLLSAGALVALMFVNGAARAQVSMELSEGTLKAPWEKHLAVLQSLGQTITGFDEGKTRVAVVDALFFLESGISEYESKTSEVIDRLAGDPQFAYEAADVSLEMSKVLDQVYAQFENLYGALEVSEREDVLGAQQALDDLRRLLRMKRPFDVDVVNALGSGIPQIIIGLAERWWHGEEKAALTREYIATMRKKFE